MKEDIRAQIEESIKIKNLLLEDRDFIESISGAAETCIEALRNGSKILLAGNGGSAADAQHIAAELVNRFGFDRPALAAIALTTDSSIMTSVSNDSDFTKVFTRQVEAIGKKGDVLIAYSTSGTSSNIIDAIKQAGSMGMFVIGLTGSNGGSMKDICNILIKAPSASTPRIQEVHALVGHIICRIIENKLFL
jgi:D-sedoheptulose 7-phosphate isomerase